MQIQSLCMRLNLPLLGIAATLLTWALVTSCGDLRLGLPGFTELEPDPIVIAIPPNASSLNAQAFGDNPRLVTLNTRVTWRNDDSVQHTTTATNGDWDSGPINPGESFARTFTEEEVLPYFCSIHPNETGTLEVQDTTIETFPTARPSPTISPLPTASPSPFPSP